MCMVCFSCPIKSCSLIGGERSREQSDDVSYANESRDPLEQYPYCLSRAVIGYYLK